VVKVVSQEEFNAWVAQQKKAAGGDAAPAATATPAATEAPAKNIKK
jgi:heme/copper-type cytochrome/quinol oxidase subunit 2